MINLHLTGGSNDWTKIHSFLLFLARTYDIVPKRLND